MVLRLRIEYNSKANGKGHLNLTIDDAFEKSDIRKKVHAELKSKNLGHIIGTIQSIKEQKKPSLD